MKLVIGLGNPGTEYEHTRHNAGFLAVDFLQKQLMFPPFTDEKKFNALISVGMIDTVKTLLVKPTTFMNQSGAAVAAIARFYKIDHDDITVTHDDLDLAFGIVKRTDSSRAAGHNGVQSVIDALGTQDFHRIRIGIGRPSDDRPPADYVLARFTPDEETTLSDIFTTIFKEV